ncbi:dual specificity protein phosphatase family protein [Martelella limonii]|uniref:dual specificity protein phosphatase family protein n=1 Tax=Martelella limonii TaxID=1647649 RepID=UPI0015810F79|nr:dual specificity protein phosphatase family protein [Martelella limonii]
MRIARRVLSVFAIAAAGSALYLGALQLTGNFHEVKAGELYRSAQPDAAALAGYIERYGIKTVINLRGAKPGKAWYDTEVATAGQAGITHIDFAMSDRRALEPERSMELLALMRDAEKPILIHCKAGADRTGLASVLYLQQLGGIDEETAEWQLSPLYGHVALPGIGPYAMDSTWEGLEKIFGLDS